MAKKSKIKFGGSGTKAGNLIRKVVKVVKTPAKVAFPRVAATVALAKTVVPKKKAPVPNLVQTGPIAPALTSYSNLVKMNRDQRLAKERAMTAEYVATGKSQFYDQPYAGSLPDQGNNLGSNYVPPPTAPRTTTPRTTRTVSVTPSYAGDAPIVEEEPITPVAPTNPVFSAAGIVRSPGLSTVRAPGGLVAGGNIPSAAGSGMILAPDSSGNPISPEFDYALTAEERALADARDQERAYYEKLARERVDREDIMRNTLRQFQGEIDATNAVYADKITQAKLAGADRLGTTRAENFNSGAQDSSFGNAALERTGAYNREQEGAIMNEKLRLLSEIEGRARALGEQYYQDKKAAKEAGLESYMKSLTGAKEAKDTIAANIAASIFDSGIEVDEIAPKKLEKIAKNAGVSVRTIREYFVQVKQEAEAAAVEAAQKAAKAEADLQFNLSEGQARYDKDGNLIASRAKTYAPKDGGGSNTVSPGAVLADFPADIQAAAQSIADGKSKLNEYPSAKRLQINQAFATLYTAEGGNELAQGAYDAITNLETHPGFKGAIGAKSGSSLFGLKGKPISGTQAAGFLKQLDTLKANIKLVNIKYLKGTGALSDAEGKTLEDAGTSLDPSLPEADFKRELARVKAVLLKANNIATGGAPNIIVAPDGLEVEIID